jgi:hypothetical protein
MEMLREGLPRALSQWDSWARVTVGRGAWKVMEVHAMHAAVRQHVCAHTIRYDLIFSFPHTYDHACFSEHP